MRALLALQTLDSCHMDFFIGMKMKISCRHGGGGGLIGYWYGMVCISYFASCVSENDCSLLVFISQTVTIQA